MKLTKETRNKVQIGTKLSDIYSEYVVTNMWTVHNGKGILVTLQCLSCNIPNHQWMNGRKLYGYSLSNCYGMEMKGE